MMPQHMPCTLIKHARILHTEGIIQGDVLIGAGKILATGESLQAPWQGQVIDAQGKWLLPGIIDQHVHLIGGGGEDGFHTRTPEVMLSQLLRAGVTGVMGLLGTDGTTRHVASLFAKVMGLRNEGISAWMLTGSYEVPTMTLTGSVRDDITFLTPVLGVKTAISDHRSSQPTVAELIRMATQARSAALLTRKPGLVVMHLGNAAAALAPLEETLAQCDVPVQHFLPTHINRQRHLLDDGLRLAKTLGVNLDFTSGIDPALGARGAVSPAESVLEALDTGIALSQLTLSSDGNGSIPVFDEQGNISGLTVAGFDSLLTTIAQLTQTIPLAQAWQLVSGNVAQRLKCSTKGKIATGCDADLLLLDEDFQVHSLWARGNMMMHDRELLAKGTFER
ncbi:MAG: Isoaspartyl dipeptidase [Candidatus Erwinia impunctatus]|nr:Isoaspartyl dipeptidase [Culicoides impunctatus]